MMTPPPVAMPAKKTDNQKNNCSGGTNCSKGIIVGKIADNPRHPPYYKIAEAAARETAEW